MNQRTIAATIQGSQMSYPPKENASQIPRTIVPTMPIPTAAPAIRATGPKRSVASGVSARRAATVIIQKQAMPATRAKALRTCSARAQSSRLTGGTYKGVRRAASLAFSSGGIGSAAASRTNFLNSASKR